MKKDALHQYQAVRKTLEKEMHQLRTRLAEITQALGNTISEAIAPDKSKKRVKRGKRRIKNEMSLKEAVLKVTAAKPLNRKEILQELGKVGYKFDTSKPMGSLNTMLYTNKATFQNKEQKFSPKKK